MLRLPRFRGTTVASLLLFTLITALPVSALGEKRPQPTASAKKSTAAAKQKLSPAAGAKSCSANLKRLDAATEQWAMEHRKRIGARATAADLVGKDKYLDVEPRCPSGGAYRYGVLGKDPTCSVKAHNARPSGTRARKR